MKKLGALGKEEWLWRAYGEGSREAVDVVLHRRTRKGTIRRLARGVYDFPEKHPVLGPRGAAGTYRGEVSLNAASGPTTRFTAPEVKRAETVHILLRLRDDGDPPLCAYRRAVVTMRPWNFQLPSPDSKP